MCVFPLADQLEPRDRECATQTQRRLEVDRGNGRNSPRSYIRLIEKGREKSRSPWQVTRKHAATENDQSDSSIFLARIDTLRWFRRDLTETLWIEATSVVNPRPLQPHTSTILHHRHRQRCAVSCGIQEAQSSGSMQHFIIVFQLSTTDCFGSPRRALCRIVSSSQTSFPVRSKCLSASFPADGSALSSSLQA